MFANRFTLAATIMLSSGGLFYAAPVAPAASAATPALLRLRVYLHRRRASQFIVCCVRARLVLRLQKTRKHLLGVDAACRHKVGRASHLDLGTSPMLLYLSPSPARSTAERVDGARHHRLVLFEFSTRGIDCRSRLHENGRRFWGRSSAHNDLTGRWHLFYYLRDRIESTQG